MADIPMHKEVKTKCKKCGRMSPADQFVLDSYERMMICPLCRKEKEEKSKVIKNEPLPAKKQQKQESGIKYVGEDRTKIKHTCARCNHDFVYDTVSKHPKLCPYCGVRLLQNQKEFKW